MLDVDDARLQTVRELTPDVETLNTSGGDVVASI